MAGNSVKLEFAGDADKLARAAKQAEASVMGVGDSVSKSADDMGKAAKESVDYGDKIGKLGAGVSGMTDAVDSAGAAVQALADIQSAGAQRAAALARANVDVRQATEDMAQATRDASQAQIDSKQAVVDEEQARLDQTVALKDYNAAVKEHGKGSVEARQAQIDLKQAGLDVKQAQEDAAQATRDGAQASIDAKSASLDLADAQKEANPPDLQKWADQINMVAPLLSGLIGVVGLITAAQWAWNAAQLASPTTWIIVGIIALIAIIVLIATKTRWFQDAWKASWSAIKGAAKAVWDWLSKIPGWLQTAFGKIYHFIVDPFKAAFNQVANLWNSTVGALSWTVPGWVPGVGGNTISVPNIPTFHSGGVVPGVPGSEVVAMVQAGETIGTAVSSGSGGEQWMRIDDSLIGRALLEVIANAMNANGGRVTALGVKVVNGKIRT